MKASHTIQLLESRTFRISSNEQPEVGDRYGRKYVIWFSILGSSPFALLLPYCNMTWTIILAILVGLVMSSAMSAILVYGTELLPGNVGMISGAFFGLSFVHSGARPRN